MVTFRVRHIVVAACLLASLVQSARALEKPAPIRRIRVLAPCLKTLVEATAAASATARSLVTRIEQSNLIVYVRCVTFMNAPFLGRLTFLSTVAGQRYVVIELRNPEPWPVQAATIGHELQHAVEIADAPWVNSQASMGQYYRRIGITVGTKPLTFDTDAARQAGLRVQHELNALHAAPVTQADAGHGGGSR